MNAMDAALIGRAMGDSNRLKILSQLADGEKCACKLLEAFDIAQPTLSHHMRVLCECGLVTARREGKWSHYALNRDTLSDFRRFVEALESGGAGV